MASTFPAVKRRWRERIRAWVPKRWIQEKKKEQEKAESGNRGTKSTRDTESLRAKSKPLQDRPGGGTVAGVTETETLVSLSPGPGGGGDRQRRRLRLKHLHSGPVSRARPGKKWLCGRAGGWML